MEGGGSQPIPVLTDIKSAHLITNAFASLVYVFSFPPQRVSPGAFVELRPIQFRRPVSQQEPPVDLVLTTDVVSNSCGQNIPPWRTPGAHQLTWAAQSCPGWSYAKPKVEVYQEIDISDCPNYLLFSIESIRAKYIGTLIISLQTLEPCAIKCLGTSWGGHCQSWGKKDRL